MVAYTNFYETQKEAEMRLSRTVVLYDGRPYLVLCILNHTDGVFRMYLDDILNPKGMASNNIHLPCHDYPSTHPSLPEMMDNVMKTKGGENILRKMMNSPAFNKFRPFPLGMVNINGGVMFCERSPTRSTHQGLTQQMISQTPVTILPKAMSRDRRQVGYTSPELGKTIVGDYPSAQECLKALADPRVANEGAAFHRLFAFLRGPLDMMFLAYKGDVVGSLPNHDLSCVSLGREFRHCKEAVHELGVFADIKIRS